MSKKITHEQARESIEMVDGSFFPTEKETLLTYIKQQEQLDEYLRISYDRDIKAYSGIRKLNKLLELYKKVASAIVRTSIEQPIYVIRISEREMVEQSFNRIKELEND